MPKSTDVPSELKEFNKLFERLAYRYDSASVFDDYLNYCIEVFKINRTGEEVEQLKKKYGEQYVTLVELFHEHLRVQNVMVAEDGSWYDLLGTFYECVRSNSKASRMGQFFTPATICDLMAMNTIGEDITGQWKRINDCACGSGRTLLAVQARWPGNYLYGEDLDPMCAKMCAINFCIHGCVGQVCNCNTLDPSDWRCGYEINAGLGKYGIIGLRMITKEESFSYQTLEARRTAPVDIPSSAEKKKPKQKPSAQLSMFEEPETDHG